MPGRKLLTDADWIPTHFGAYDPEMIRRRAVLAETINRFDNGKLIPHYQKLAQQNLANWSTATFQSGPKFTTKSKTATTTR